MIRALWIAKTGLEAQDKQISVISNNLANVNTNAFKESRVIFEDLLYQNLRQPGGASSANTELPTGLTLGTGVKIVATQQIHTEGNVIRTDNPLDIAINGSGFLQVTRPDGSTAYTRDGALQLNADGQVVTASGDPIQPAITIPQTASSVTIGLDGTVSIVNNGETSSSTIGNITIADFINPSGLLPIGQNLLQETSASGTPVVGTPGDNGLGQLNQSALETSNVNSVEQLISMITVQRSYEMNSKAISAANEMLQTANQQIQA